MKLKLDTIDGSEVYCNAQKAFRLYGFDFYVHHTLLEDNSFHSSWEVTEVKTGKAIMCFEPTKTTAIKAAKKCLLNKGMKIVKARISSQLVCK